MSGGGIGAVAVVGTGVIGASWAAHFLAHGPGRGRHRPGARRRGAAAGRRGRALAGADRARPATGASPDRLDLHRRSRDGRRATRTSCRRTARSGGPQARAVRRAGRGAPGPTWCSPPAPPGCCRRVIAGAAAREHPERVLIGHPFNPPHLIPLVEVVPGETDRRGRPSTRALAFYTAVGKTPDPAAPGGARARRQPAAGRAVAGGLLAGRPGRRHRSPTSTPRSPTGPGLRWAVLGPFVNQHLSGGAGGLAHNLEHLGPPIEAWWHDLRPARPHPGARRPAGRRRGRRAGAASTRPSWSPHRDAVLTAPARRETTGRPDRTRRSTACDRSTWPRCRRHRHARAHRAGQPRLLRPRPGADGRLRRVLQAPSQDRTPTLEHDRRATTARRRMAAVVFTVDAGTAAPGTRRCPARRSPTRPPPTPTC